jgi:hypothetical protein
MFNSELPLWKMSGYADKILAVAYMPNVAAPAFGSVHEK